LKVYSEFKKFKIAPQKNPEITEKTKEYFLLKEFLSLYIFVVRKISTAKRIFSNSPLIITFIQIPKFLSGFFDLNPLLH
jgi:hypothetical protein